MKRCVRQTAVCLLMVILVCFLQPLAGLWSVYGDGNITIETTLENGSIQRGSKKTFDVIARDGRGNKLSSSVTLNNVAVSYNWDDTDKTSYTLHFTKEGENVVIVSAGGKSVKYTIYYKEAVKGDIIGQATFSVELFTIGEGYLIEPVPVDIVEGENAAYALIKLLHQKGYIGYYTGSLDDSFYLGYIAEGTKTAEKYNGYNSSAYGYKALETKKTLNLNPQIPSLLYPYLEKSMYFFDDTDYTNYSGYMGEFIFTNGSGWMYSVNDVFPNVGFADTYLSDGDVVRVQFTLGYGADIGGAGAMGGSFQGAGSIGGNYYTVANKDRLTKLLAEAKDIGSSINVKEVYNNAIGVIQTLNATQQQVDAAYTALSNALYTKPEENTELAESIKPEESIKPTESVKPQETTKPTESTQSQEATKQEETTKPAIGMEPQETIKPKEEENVLSIAGQIVDWKKADMGSGAEEYLLNDRFLELAGTTPGDWFPVGLGRLGIEDDYESYLAVIRDVVQKAYREEGKLSGVKATEWHRITLAVLAMGGDPTDMGKDENGETIDLIADGTYNRGYEVPLGKQGINGWIWGLIALDSMRYEIPEGSCYTRKDILLEILKCQLEDGGFALTGSVADPDMTAMAVQALAPYYNSETVYSYTEKASGRVVQKNVRQVTDEALDCLSNLQLDTGGYASWGTENVESVNQVVVALCSLGIEPFTDVRFVKGGNTLMDGIMQYHQKDGGFAHSYTYDRENPTALPGESNTMAGEQTLYTMAAVWRQMNHMRTLYDFRPEQSESIKERILALEERIANIAEGTSVQEFERLLTEYYSLPENERSYVRNYWTLSDLAKAAGIDVKQLAKTTEVSEVSKEDVDRAPESALYFLDSDKKEVEELPEVLTTEYYVQVIRLLDKLERSEDFEGKEDYLNRLNKAKREIEAIQREIDSVNKKIKEKLYPFEDISWEDRAVIDDIMERYEKLSEYDRTKINNYEDVLRAHTKLSNQLRAFIISIVAVSVCIALGIVAVVGIHKRKHAAQRAMEELEAQYENEEE